MYIYSVTMNDRVEDVVSLLPPDKANEIGLPPQSIIGKLLTSVDRGGELSNDNLVVNPGFVELIHQIIAEYAPRLDTTKQQAQQQVNGWLYMIDRRRPNAEMLDPLEQMLDDIIGAFEVIDSQIVPGSYQPMATHQLISHRGVFELEPELHTCLMEKIASAA